MSDNLRSAITELQGELDKQLRDVAETKRLINRLCRRVGDPEMHPDAEEGSSETAANIRSDQFFGKAVATAIREVLEMRQRANLGAATVREIYDALRKGGFQFDTKSDTNAKRGLRISLTKNTAAFVKLPNGTFGLREWYPDLKSKRPRKNAGAQEAQAENEVAENGDPDDAEVPPEADQSGS